MALVLLLLVVSASVVLTLHAQITSALAMRRAQRRLLRVNLRLAATDAAWNSILDATASNEQTGSTNSMSSALVVLPSGIEASVNVSPFRGSVGVGSTNAENLVVIKSVASVSGMTETVSCMLERPESGKARVLAWNQAR